MHVTDIHCAYDKIKQLQQWLRDSSNNVDVVFISGDIANIPVEFYNTASKELQKEHEEHLKSITKSFKSIAGSVYFIPGNVINPDNWCSHIQVNQCIAVQSNNSLSCQMLIRAPFKGIGLDSW